MTSDAFLKKLKNVLTTSDTSSEGLRAQHQRPIDVLTRFWADEDNQDVKELVSRHVRFLKDAAADADEKKRLTAGQLRDLGKRLEPETFQAVRDLYDSVHPGCVPMYMAHTAAADADDDSSGPPSLASSSDSEKAFSYDEIGVFWRKKAEEAFSGSAPTASASSSQPPSLASSSDSSPATSPRAASGAPARGSGSGVRSHFSPSKALGALFDPETSPDAPPDAPPETAEDASNVKPPKDASKPGTTGIEPANERPETAADAREAGAPPPSPPEPPRRNPIRFSDAVALARGLARASVAKALKALEARDDAVKEEVARRSAARTRTRDGASGSSSASPRTAGEKKTDVLVRRRVAQLEYFRVRQSLARHGGEDEDSPWTSERRARRVLKELYARLGIDGSPSSSSSSQSTIANASSISKEASASAAAAAGEEKGKQNPLQTELVIAGFYDKLARRVVDDATHVEWLLHEPAVAREWRYENTVRTCEFHKRALRRDARGNPVNDDFFGDEEEASEATRSRLSNAASPDGPSRCYEAAPEVCGAAARAGPRCVRSLGRCFEVSCEAGHADVVVHARCWHRNCVERDEDTVYGPLLSRLPTELGFDPEDGGEKTRAKAAETERARSADGLPDPDPEPFLSFAQTEVSAAVARRRACAMWVTKFPTCPVAGCRAKVIKATYFSDAPETDAEPSSQRKRRSIVAANCEDWINFFYDEVRRTFSAEFHDRARDASGYDDNPERVARLLGGGTGPFDESFDNFERILDFVAAREEMRRATLQTNSLDSSTFETFAQIDEMVSDMYDAARVMGAGFDPADLTPVQKDFLRFLMGFRRGRARADGTSASEPVAPGARFSLESSPNPFYAVYYADYTKRNHLSDDVVNVTPGLHFFTFAALASRAFEGRDLEDPANPANPFVSARNPDDETTRRDVAFHRFATLYFDALRDALVLARRRDEANARATLERVRARYDEMRAIRERAYDAIAAVKKALSSKKKARACFVSYEEVDLVAEANERDLLEEEERRERRERDAALRAERAAEARREKQRLKKKAKKQKEKEEKEALEREERDKKEEAAAAAATAKKRLDEELSARREEAARAEREAREKEAADLRRGGEDSSASRAETNPAAATRGASSSRGGGAGERPAVVGQQTQQIASSSLEGSSSFTDAGGVAPPPATVPTRVFLMFLMRNRAVVERWVAGPNGGCCLSCGARVPERHKRGCAIPAAACDEASPNDALRALQRAEDSERSGNPPTTSEDDASARAFSGLTTAPRRGSRAGAESESFSGLFPTAPLAWTPPAPAPAPAPAPVARLDAPRRDASVPDAWGSARERRDGGAGSENARARKSARERRWAFAQPATVPAAFTPPDARERKKAEEEEHECIICFEATLDADDLAAAKVRKCGCGKPMHLLCLAQWRDERHKGNLDLRCPHCWNLLE